MYTTHVLKLSYCWTNWQNHTNTKIRYLNRLGFIIVGLLLAHLLVASTASFSTTQQTNAKKKMSKQAVHRAPPSYRLCPTPCQCIIPYMHNTVKQCADIHPVVQTGAGKRPMSSNLHHKALLVSVVLTWPGWLAKVSEQEKMVCLQYLPVYSCSCVTPMCVCNHKAIKCTSF